MRHDLRLALRGLGQQPAFTAIAVLIVALGAGANAAVFSVVHAVLLRPLPYPDPGRLVAIAPTSFFSAADLQLLRDRMRSFAGPLTAIVRENLARPRMMAVLLSVFAAVGVAIVLCGVYGVVAYTVRRREREMGIRLALGAAPSAVAALVLRQGFSYAVAASLLGIPLAVAGSRVMRGLLFGVQPHDPATLTFISSAVVSATLAATLVPAWRVGRVEAAAVLKGN